jgi:hypothetical protein
MTIINGIVNLFVRDNILMSYNEGKVLQSNERWGDLCGYAASFTLVTSFHVWNRSCNVARYSCARRRCRRGWKWPEMRPKAERTRCACLAGVNRRIFFSLFQTPLTHRFVGHSDSSLCQKLFHIAKTEREAKIQPNSVADDFNRKAVAFVIGGSGVCFHGAILAQCSVPLSS